MKETDRNDIRDEVITVLVLLLEERRKSSKLESSSKFFKETIWKICIGLRESKQLNAMLLSYVERMFAMKKESSISNNTLLPSR